MVEAYRCSSGLHVLIQEKLGQSHDILTHLSECTSYTEQTVSVVAAQILDGLQYLHWRGYCHLDIQPDNIVVTSPRSAQIKLVDFGSARHVSKLGTRVPFTGN
ncbi:obscurin-like [Ctenocephalides felis]|nr:obscurin-like [Ctenocephalides felis]